MVFLTLLKGYFKIDLSLYLRHTYELGFNFNIEEIKKNQVRVLYADPLPC